MPLLKLLSWNMRSLLVLGFGLLWIFFSRTTPAATTGGAVPAPQVGFAAPDFSLQDASGETVTLSELRGHPLIVNVWASWCPPCRAEMPAMQRVYQDYRDAGLEILAVNAANQDQTEAALAFVEQNGLTFPILFDEVGSVSQHYQVRALPTSFFIDAQGIIQEIVVGGPMSEALLRIRVAELIEGQR